MQEFNHFKEAVMAAIIDLAKVDDKIVFLDADLSSCIGSTTFEIGRAHV